MLGFIKTADIIMPLYKFMVQPHLEYILCTILATSSHKNILLSWKGSKSSSKINDQGDGATSQWRQAAVFGALKFRENVNKR